MWCACQTSPFLVNGSLYSKLVVVACLTTFKLDKILDEFLPIVMKEMVWNSVKLPEKAKGISSISNFNGSSVANSLHFQRIVIIHYIQSLLMLCLAVAYGIIWTVVFNFWANIYMYVLWIWSFSHFWHIINYLTPECTGSILVITILVMN